MLGREAERETVGGSASTVTVAESVADPPELVHTRVYVLVLVMLPVDSGPPVDDLVPLHAPDAVHVEGPPPTIQDKSDAVLYGMVVGEAKRVRVGGSASTVTVAASAANPEPFVHVRVYVLVLVMLPVDSTPPVDDLIPLHAPPDATHVEGPPPTTQVRVEAVLYGILVGVAVSVRVGFWSCTVTVAESIASPPALVHVSVYVLVLVMLPVDSGPPVDDLVPLHAPDAVHVEGPPPITQVRVEAVSYGMGSGLAERETVGG